MSDDWLVDITATPEVFLFLFQRFEVNDATKLIFLRNMIVIPDDCGTFIYDSERFTSYTATERDLTVSVDFKPINSIFRSYKGIEYSFRMGIKRQHPYRVCIEVIDTDEGEIVLLLQQETRKRKRASE